MSLIVFGIGVGLGAIARRKKMFPEYYKKKEFRKEIIKNWNETIEYAKGESIRNKVDQSYEILDIIEKHYGADCIVSIPKGLNINGFKGLMESLECSLKCDIMADISSEKNSIYARLIYSLDDLGELEAVKFKWNTLMILKDLTTMKNETFKIKKIESKAYGYDMTIQIPIGKKFSDIEAVKDDIENSFQALTKMEWRRYDGEIDIKIITTPLTNDTKFVPVKTESPHHVLYGKTHYQENIIVDIYQFPMCLVSGATGMGKTYGIQTMITNILHFWSDYVEMYFAELSDKPDFEPFKNCKSTQSYCTEIKECLGMFRYLNNEMDRRNKMFKEKETRDIKTYNKKFPNEKLKDILIFADEFSEFMPANSKEPYHEEKEEMYNLINRIVKQGRSTGVIIGAFGVQRPDATDVLPNLKSNMNVKICYAQNNAASSKVVCDSAEAVGLPQTEALVIWGNNKEQVKTLWLDDVMIDKYLSHCKENNHKLLHFNIEGNIIQDSKIIQFPTTNNQELNESTIETTVNNEEISKETEHERKQRERKEKWQKRKDSLKEKTE